MLPTLPGGSVACRGNTIAEGDMVIVYESPSSMKAVTIKSGARYDNKFGSFAHKDWIGLPYGSKVFSKAGARGWVHLLAPSADLWTQVLKHRTQILYIADISMAVSFLDLRPGSVVLESGTGSGSLTHSLIRAVAPVGHVHTFEFHSERAAEAEREFKEHGLSQCVTVRQRNIEEQGFPCGAATEAEGMIDLTQQADAVFLDLPAPHKAIPSAARCLKPDGRLCSFSPCIEQVQKSCEALEKEGFTDLQTYECLLRVHEVHTDYLQVPDLGVSSSAEGAAPRTGAKRPREDSEAVGKDEELEGASTQGDAAGPHQGAVAAGSGGGKKGPRLVAQHRAVITTRPAMDARGHTGYLTFARKFVSVTQ